MGGLNDLFRRGGGLIDRTLRDVGVPIEVRRVVRDVNRETRRDIDRQEREQRRIEQQRDRERDPLNERRYGRTDQDYGDRERNPGRSQPPPRTAPEVREPERPAARVARPSAEPVERAPTPVPERKPAPPPEPARPAAVAPQEAAPAVNPPPIPRMKPDFQAVSAVVAPPEPPAPRVESPAIAPTPEPAAPSRIETILRNAADRSGLTTPGVDQAGAHRAFERMVDRELRGMREEGLPREFTRDLNRVLREQRTEGPAPLDQKIERAFDELRSKYPDIVPPRAGEQPTIAASRPAEPGAAVTPEQPAQVASAAQPAAALAQTAVPASVAERARGIVTGMDDPMRIAYHTDDPAAGEFSRSDIIRLQEGLNKLIDSGHLKIEGVDGKLDEDGAATLARNEGRSPDEIQLSQTQKAMQAYLQQNPAAMKPGMTPADLLNSVEKTAAGIRQQGPAVSPDAAPAIQDPQRPVVYQQPTMIA